MRLKLMFGAALCCALCHVAPSAQALETFEAGLLGSANSAGWPWYIALAKGFFTEAGLAPDVIYAPTPSGLMQQLAAGSLDVVDIGMVEPIHAVARGASVAILRITGAVPPYEMVANVKTVKELKGKTIVIGGLIDINRVYLERVMKANGLKTGDYDITTVGNTPGRFAALKSGAADATMLAPPFNFFAEAAGFHNVAMVIDYAKDLPFGATNVSLAYAQKHRDTLLKFMAVLDKSSAWFNDRANRDGAIEVLVEAMNGANRDDVARSYDYLRNINYFASTSEVSRSRLQSLMAEMKALGDTEENVPVEKLVIPGLTRIVD